MFLGREPMDPNSQEFNDLQAYVASLTPNVYAKMKQFEKERAALMKKISGPANPCAPKAGNPCAPKQ
jgi:hypothetical protein